MNSKVKLLAGIAGLAAVIGISMALYQTLGKSYTPQSPLAPDASQGTSQPPSSGEEEKIKAPDFTVYDGDGNVVKLSDFAGKPVVVNFWASWCPPCKAEMPEFNKVWGEVGNEVSFLIINATDGSRETVEKAKDYIASQGFSFPVYYDTSQEASYTYGVSSLPTTLFIDSEGYLVTGAEGQINEAMLRKGIGFIHPQAEE